MGQNGLYLASSICLLEKNILIKRRHLRFGPFITNYANEANFANKKDLLKKETLIRNICLIRVIRDKDCYDSSTGDEPRLLMKRAAKRLTALLMQYNSRPAGGEVFLEEGRRIASAYGRDCADMGFSLSQIMPIFLLFRRSILDAIHQTAHLGGSEDPEGQLLFCRTNDFLDALMVALISSFHSWEGAKNDAVNPTA